MTTDIAPPLAAPAPAASRYGRLWRSVPRELGFLLLSFPVALVGFITALTLFATGVGSLVVLFGIVLVVGSLYVGRGFGWLELRRLAWAGRPAIAQPEWQDARARQSFTGWLRALFGNGHYWLYLLHTMVVNFLVALVTWTVTVFWLGTGFGLVSQWAWADAGRATGDLVSGRWTFPAWIVDVVGGAGGQSVLEDVAKFLLGIAMLALLPLVTRGLTVVHDAIARGMLGPFPSDAMQRQIIALNVSRGAASAAEGHSLRRLERDIHDGPQQRLVRLQMDLAAADRQLDVDPAKARILLGEAMAQSREALEELRALSRGFAPPILLDRGLVAALQSAAARSTVPTRITSTLPATPGSGAALPQELERNAYFIASEAMLNAAKHSSATVVDVTVHLRRVADTDDTWLDVVVSDNGRGGAHEVPGHGIAGLQERVRGLGGVLELASPAGGPTTLAAHLPVTTSLGGSTSLTAAP